MSNLILIVCLIIGFIAGLKSKSGGQSKAHSHLLLASIIILIFCMGVILGFDPDLPGKIITYGVSAFVITGLSVLFGVIIVWIIVKTVRFKS